MTLNCFYKIIKSQRNGHTCHNTNALIVNDFELSKPEEILAISKNNFEKLATHTAATREHIRYVNLLNRNETIQSGQKKGKATGG